MLQYCIMNPLGLRNLGENFLTRRKDGHWIVISLPLDKSCPLISKMSLPFLLRSVVREVQLEIKAVGEAILDDFLVLNNQFINRGALRLWSSET